MGDEVCLGAGDTGTPAAGLGAIEPESTEAKRRCDGLVEPGTRRSSDNGFGHASCRRRGRFAFRSAFEGGKKQAGLLADRDLSIRAALLDVGKRLDDGGLAENEVLLADGKLFLDAPAFGRLDSFGGVVDGVDRGVRQSALAIAQAQDEFGGVDL